MMEFAGVRDSEETFAGPLPDGRSIVVASIGLFDPDTHPEHLDPQHWLTELDAGKFDDQENPPSVWTERYGQREWRNA
jgi:hypothetical protein